MSSKKAENIAWVVSMSLVCSLIKRNLEETQMNFFNRFNRKDWNHTIVAEEWKIPIEDAVNIRAQNFGTVVVDY